MRVISKMRVHETVVTVRFYEVDSYRVAWHGHYVGWMEAGRNELSAKFDLDPDHLLELGFIGPVVALEIKYLRPARYNDRITVRTTLEDSETAILKFRSEILASDGKRLASGFVSHALTDSNGVLLYRVPRVISERITRMKNWLIGQEQPQ